MSEQAGRTMRLCFLGCGRAAESHSRTARAFRPHVECSYASRSVDKARAFADRYGGARAFDGYRRAVESPDIDAVAVVTPPSLHLEWTLAALDAGKDVLLEKPPVLRSADFDAIERAAARAGRFVLVRRTTLQAGRDAPPRVPGFRHDRRSAVHPVERGEAPAFERLA